MSNRPRSSTALLVSLCLCALCATSVALAETGFLSVKGSKQGEFKGSVTLKGREGTIKVIAVAHAVVTPTDVTSGMVSGKRQHKPFVITKEIDRSSPLFHTAQASGETLSQVELQLFAVSAKGMEVNHYTIALKTARIVAMEQITEEAGAGKSQLLERISFSYETITWTWTDGGLTSTDGAAGAKQ